MERVSCDVLVLGSGSAGLRAAISARQTGLDVCVVSKRAPGRATCTWMSAGVMAGSTSTDTRSAHARDTILAGRGINERELVEVLVEEAPSRLLELKEWGVQAEFQNGYLFCKGRPPALGQEIVRCLIRRNRDLGTRFLGDVLVTDLVLDHGAGAARLYSSSSKEWIVISARAVILATGGAAGLYLRHDNPQRMLGEGYRLAFEAGAVLQDMEFVQFYPVCLAEPGQPPLVVPPRLADCGRLVNDRGEDILAKYGIEERPAGERARDSLSQALFVEIYRRGLEVWLDFRDLSEKQWSIDPFSASLAPILKERFGATQRPVRVAPAAHHTMGGVKITKACETSVPGLFAAGECTGGLHGANRMGGNALSETLVFGARAGRSASEWAQGQGDVDLDLPVKQLQERGNRRAISGAVTADLLARLRSVMWRDGGLVRNAEGLVRAADEVAEIHEASAGMPAECEGWDLIRILELNSAARVAALILRAALKRQESRGAHLREDFPEQDDVNWRGHMQVSLKNGQEHWHYVPE